MFDDQDIFINNNY